MIVIFHTENKKWAPSGEPAFLCKKGRYLSDGAPVNSI